MKSMITPGRLYAMLSNEYRKARCEDCANCSLPLPEPLQGGSNAATWTLGALTRECEHCAKTVARIVSRYQAKYDLLDPFTHPPAGQSKSPPPMGTFH